MILHCVCSWCGCDIRTGDAPEPISHGLCEPCAADLLAEDADAPIRQETDRAATRPTGAERESAALIGVRPNDSARGEGQEGVTMLRFLLRWLHRNTYRQRRDQLNDALTLACKVGKPQAAGLTTDRTRVDKR